MRWRFLLMIACATLGLLCAPLALAAFSNVNPSASDALTVLAVAESILARSFRVIGVDAYWRGLGYLTLSCAAIWAAAYIKPRA